MIKVIQLALKIEEDTANVGVLKTLEKISELIENNPDRKQSMLLSAMYSIMILALIRNPKDPEGEKTEDLMRYIIIKGTELLKDRNESR